MRNNQPEYDDWINKWVTDSSYRVQCYERLLWISAGVLLGLAVGAQL